MDIVCATVQGCYRNFALLPSPPAAKRTRRRTISGVERQRRQGSPTNVLISLDIRWCGISIANAVVLAALSHPTNEIGQVNIIKAPFNRRAAPFILLLIGSNASMAQELEPRAYGNAPVGLNFLIAGFSDARGGVVLDPSIALDEANIRVQSGVLAYARSLGLGGRSAKFDVIAPYAELSGRAQFEGRPVERDVAGIGDARLRFSYNLHGAPALSLRDISAYRQDLIIGMSVQLWVPLGQYDAARLVNIGSNRWAIKPEIGLSKALGRWTLEFAAAVALFEDNHRFLGQRTREQAPVYSVQSGIIYSFANGAWFALGGTYYTGGRTKVDDVSGNDLQNNSRLGLTLALPVNRRNSIRFHANTGVSIRSGSNFDAASISWQYRWGGGL
jgi:hypothetical protein